MGQQVDFKYKTGGVWGEPDANWAFNNGRAREVPSLVERAPNGGYIIPSLYNDDGYSSMSNKSSPAKELHATAKNWPESPGYGATYNELTAIMKSQYGYNAFLPSQMKNVSSITAPSTQNLEGYGCIGAGDTALNAQMFLPKAEPEMYARKVFVGGLPIDVKEMDIYRTFRQFGPLLIDWPRRSDKENAVSNSSRTMSGYVFLVYENETSVQMLVSKCYKENDKLFLLVSSPTMRNKPVQVRPWRLSDTEFIVDKQMKMWPRRTVFIGGLPRPTRANDLAEAVAALYGHVTYVGIDIDPELKYPKGAARVVFTSSESLVAAIRGKFVHIPHSDVHKRVEIKPYVMDDQMCDQCEGRQCGFRYASYFCGDVDCLQYYCETCWDALHTPEDGTFDHKPLVRCGEQTKLLARPPHHQLRQNTNAHHGHRNRHHYF